MGDSGPMGGGDGGDADPSDWEEEATSSSDNECGDNGALPGGIGGMGQDGECIGGGGGSSSAAESSSSASASGGGGGGDASASGSAGGGSAGGMQGTGGAGGVGEFPGETDAERAARLGQELEESLGGFDEELQDEQDEIAAVGRSTEGFGDGSQGGGGGGISLGQQGSSGSSAGGGSGGGAIAVANDRVARQSPVAGMSDEQIRERTPEDIPILVDDDIIARQLREAALAEDDPVLRERLWEEYRKYSGN
jgi:hypothetical protein